MVIMFVSTLLRIIVISYIQKDVPNNMVGRIIALLSAMLDITVPFGQLFIGISTSYLSQKQFIIYVFIFVIVLMTGMTAKKFKEVE